MPFRARASARSFNVWPLWPLTQRQSTSWRSAGLVQPPPQVLVLHRLLVGGRQPRRLPAAASTRRCPSSRTGCRCAARPCRAGSAPPAPGSRPSAPCGCWWWPARRRRAPARWSPKISTAPQPPGPGIPAAGAVGVDHHLGVMARSSNSRARPAAARCTASLRSYSSGSFGRTRAPVGRRPPVVQPGQEEPHRRARGPGSAGPRARPPTAAGGSRSRPPRRARR